MLGYWLFIHNEDDYTHKDRQNARLSGNFFIHPAASQSMHSKSVSMLNSTRMGL